MTANAARHSRATQLTKLADGRRLAWAEYGDPAGAPVLYCHGLPGSRLEAALADDAARHRGLRLIAPERPGSGRSSRNPGGDFSDWVSDLEQLLDRLDIDRVALLGVSGGGPFAIAAGVVLPARIRALALVASFSSLTEVERLCPGHGVARLLGLMRRHPRATRTLLRGLAAPVLAAAPGPALALLRLASGGADREALAEPRVRAGLSSSLREALRQRGAGALDELQLALADSAMDPRRLRCPTSVWHGGADRVVPVAAGRRLAARIPGAHLRIVPPAGHYSLPLTAIGEILDRLHA